MSATLPRSIGPLLTPPRVPGRSPRRPRRLLWLVPAAGFLVVLAPVVLLAGASNPPCNAASSPAPTGSAPGGVAEPGMFAAPLQMTPGRWYRVGATQYGGPTDPTAGSWGASNTYLPAEPNSFAELSVLDTNPANSGPFTFSDANALNNLAYGTALRVANGTRQKVLYKRDIGYGQGPGQTIPYRIDVWWQSAASLAVSKNPVSIELAPASGTAATLDQLPSGSGGEACPTRTLAGLQLTAGEQTQILPNGLATAPFDAPRAVKLAIAAANQIHDKPYSVNPGGQAVHYGPLSTLWPAYDCSGSVSYVLYKAGLHSVNADVSGALEHWGQAGPGRWITVYANSAHTFIDVAGRAFDTADYGGPDLPAGSGPRWRQNPTGNLQDGLSYVARHPTGL